VAGALALALVVLGSGAPARALDGKVALHVIRMTPSGQDADRYSRAGWGAGAQLTTALPGTAGILAGVVGLEFVNLLSETLTTYDYQTLLRIEQQTNQYFGRLYLGPEIGPHGNGTFRPHAGANIALVFYGISTDIVVPDDFDREREIRQSLRGEHKAAFGYDVTLGVDINPWNKLSFDVGARFVKSFNVPQQLGAGAETVHPGYLQGYFAVGFALPWIGRNIRD
jgi:opacity protein-like surface antigen